MRRLLSAVSLVIASVLLLAGCPEHDVDPVLYPDAWWLPKSDAGQPLPGPDAAAVAPDAAAPGEDAAAAEPPDAADLDSGEPPDAL